MLLAPSPERIAASVAHLFSDVFALLEDWRGQIEAAGDDLNAPSLDELVASLVLPHLSDADPLLIGAGFIAAPEHGRDVHFAWWLGPLDAGPIFGSTTEPTRLDLSTRGYADYLRDVRTLEWYAVPATTATTHVTGPYVDHLCTCDYIFTLTMPAYADGRMIGVVGADIAVRRLERELLPELLAADAPLALLNADGRVVLSTAPDALPGTLLATTDSVACAGVPLRIAQVSAAVPG